MEGFMMHVDGKEVKREALDLIPMPEESDTYKPVSHYHLANKLLTISQVILKDYMLIGEHYGLARNGNQMFAYLKFQKEESDMALSLAFRNSYDRSMSIGMAVGASVFVCDNLALQGEIVVMKKHTKNVWLTLENTCIQTLYKSQECFQKIVADSQVMKQRALNDVEAFKIMGLLYGRDIIGPRQLTVVKDQWLNPPHKEFEERSLWSLYNCCTEALKSSPPLTVMEKHVQLHSTVVDAEFREV
jgi:hypothetical protein